MRFKELFGSKRKELKNIPEASPESIEMREIFNANFGAKTESSMEHPDRNEDAFFVDEDEGIAGIFDGMGGHKGGQFASETGAASVLESLKSVGGELSAKEWEEKISNSMTKASQEILDLSKDDPEKMGGMGCTATILKLLETKDGKKAIIGNAGDSRAYLLRNGKLIRLTRDDSMVQELIDLKQLKDDEDLNQKVSLDFGKGKKTLTVGEIRHGITQALGIGQRSHDELKPRIRTLDILPDDMLMLSSDGIHDNLTDKEIKDILNGQEFTGSKGEKMTFERQMVQKAKAIEGDESNPRSKPDDKTAIVIKILK